MNTSRPKAEVEDTCSRALCLLLIPRQRRLSRCHTVKLTSIATNAYVPYANTGALMIVSRVLKPATNAKMMVITRTACGGFGVNFWSEAHG